MTAAGCPADPIPGIAAPMNTPDGVQACDDCGIYDDNIAAAVALAAHIPGARVYVQLDQDGLIREGTDPTIRVAGQPVDLTGLFANTR